LHRADRALISIVLSGDQSTRAKEAMSKPTRFRCKDCYFHQSNLCALQLDAPCPTFRLAVQGALTPPAQAPLIARAFEPPAPMRFLSHHQAA